MATLRREYLKTSESSYGSFTVHRLVPWIDATIGINTSIRIGRASTLDSLTDWMPYQTYTSGTTRKLDWRLNTNWMGVEFLSNTSRLQLSGYETDVSQTNRR